MHRDPTSLVARFASLIAPLATLALVAPAQADTVYFVSVQEGRLYSFNSAGGRITPLVDRSTFLEPAALAIGPDGNLYVGDSTNGGTISRYALTGGNVGQVTPVVGLAGGSPPATGVSPSSIAFTPDGRMLVGRNPLSIGAGYPTGQVVEVVGWNGGTPTIADYTSGGTPQYQTGLTATPGGTLYASNTFYDLLVNPPVLVGSVVRYAAGGAFESVIADATGGLEGPSGIVVAGTSLFTASTMNGNVYRTDLTNTDPAKNTTLFASTGGDFIGPLAQMSDGDLLVGSVSGATGLIYRFNSAGNLVGTFGGAEYQQIGGIVAVPEPGTLALAAVGLAVAAVSGIRRARRTS